MIRMTSANDWRAILAALANETSLRVFAQIVMGATPDEATSDLSPSRRRHVLGSLQKAGILNDRLELVRTRFADVLATSASEPRPAGVDRYLDQNGRVLTYPSRPEVRAELLRLLGERAFAVGEILDERQVNDRLTAHADDVALLRRHLVDYGILERTRSGSAYSLTPTASISDSV